MIPGLRIIYGCPPDNKPAGGVKVIHRQCEALRAMGIESYLWHPGQPDFKSTWFDHQAPSLPVEALNPGTDLVVLPEIWAGTPIYRMLRDAGFKLALYVQNAYMTHANLDAEEPDALRRNFAHASLVLSISSDTARYLTEVLRVEATRVVPQRYSIDFSRFAPAEKLKLITYMPRKMATHAFRVVSALTPLLPADWRIMPIDGVPEAEVARTLARSAIFMSFSDFEGLPVPPVEAAVCGNYVIGYHGEGGQEYWHEPNFEFVRSGDITSFVKRVRQVAEELDSGQRGIQELSEGIEHLKLSFGSTQELAKLQEFVLRAAEVMVQAATNQLPVAGRLQL
jgi:hypothetical protein